MNMFTLKWRTSVNLKKLLNGKNVCNIYIQQWRYIQNTTLEKDAFQFKKGKDFKGILWKMKSKHPDMKNWSAPFSNEGND